MVHARHRANRELAIAQSIMANAAMTAEQVAEFIRCGKLETQDANAPKREPYNPDLIKSLVGANRGAN